MSDHRITSTSMNPASACVAGIHAQEAGHMDEAVRHFERALVLAPALIDVRLLLAFALGAHGQNAYAHRVLTETPELATLPEFDLRRLADAAAQLGATAIALKAVRLLVEKHSDDADLQSMLGTLLHRTGAMEEAGHVLHRAVLRWPSHVPTLMNTARLLVADGNYAGALRNYDRALKVSPKHASARWQRGMLRLTIGDWAGGWTDHEARRTLPVHEVGVPAGIPAWDGKNANGKTLLLWGEQGLGDQIQGVRFAQLLASLGARVVVRCAPPLKRLFANVDGVAEVFADGEVLPSCDAHVPMLSVPFLLKLFDETSYSTGSYLLPALGTTVSSTSRHQFRDPHQLFHRTRVGFAWAGSPGHVNDQLRSLPTSQLAPLLDGVSVQWISLQVGPRAADLHLLPPHVRGAVVDVAPTLTDFIDTAHVICALDRVVTVDTSIAHIAGALGVPTLLLIPFVPDWRWQLVREDTPWYRSVTIIRQPSAGDWAGAITRARREISAGGRARAA
ncbi:MAG: tetratricopeptide repeat-containing glycosyltransferase family protein [Gemmatimonas sp.]